MDLRDPSSVWSKLCKADAFCGFENLAEEDETPLLCKLDFKLLPLSSGDFVWIVGYDKELGSKKRIAHKVDLVSGETVVGVTTFPPSPSGTSDVNIDFFLLKDKLHAALLDIDLSLMKYDEEKREWTKIDPLFNLPEEQDGVPHNEFEVRDVDCYQDGECIWFNYQVCHDNPNPLDEDDYKQLPYFNFIYATDDMGGALKFNLNEANSSFHPEKMKMQRISVLDSDKMKFAVWDEKHLKICDFRFQPDDDRFTEHSVDAIFNWQNVDRAELRRRVQITNIITHPQGLFVLNKPINTMGVQNDT